MKLRTVSVWKLRHLFGALFCRSALWHCAGVPHLPCRRLRDAHRLDVVTHAYALIVMPGVCCVCVLYVIRNSTEISQVRAWVYLTTSHQLHATANSCRRKIRNHVLWKMYFILWYLPNPQASDICHLRINSSLLLLVRFLHHSLYENDANREYIINNHDCLWKILQTGGSTHAAHSKNTHTQSMATSRLTWDELYARGDCITFALKMLIDDREIAACNIVVRVFRVNAHTQKRIHTKY